MRDQLLDILKHTVSIGTFTHLRIVGTPTETFLFSRDVDKTIVFQAKMAQPIAGFDGDFGASDIGLLNTILGIPEYDEKCTIKVDIKTFDDGTTAPFLTIFKTQAGDFENSFKLVRKNHIAVTIPHDKLTLHPWPVNITPSSLAIDRLRFQSSANPSEQFVTFSLNKGELRAKFGDGALTHTGGFVFDNTIDPAIKMQDVNIRITTLNSVFSTVGDKKMSIGDMGTTIEVDSKVGVYYYTLVGLSK